MRTVSDILPKIDELILRCRNLEFSIKLKNKINEQKTAGELSKELENTKAELNKLLSLEIKE